ncbi:hypothetical protein [Seleniivibrio sp.]|uniref:hypothetical protein n=1 Tax=Seleniivibrio sp. TaxID=2898801 RepID=UPI003424E660
MEELEKRRDSAAEELNGGKADYSRLAELQKVVDELDIQILEKYERWEYLTAQNEG